MNLVIQFDLCRTGLLRQFTSKDFKLGKIHFALKASKQVRKDPA